MLGNATTVGTAAVVAGRNLNEEFQLVNKGKAFVDDIAEQIEHARMRMPDAIVHADIAVPKLDLVVPNKSSSATRERIEANIAASAAARETSGFSKLSGYETAYNFYRNSGYDADGTIDHLRGIDFNSPVNVVTIPKGTEVIQYQIPGGPQGSYYAPVGTPGNELGFYTSGRTPTNYVSNNDVQVLQSTASTTLDDWSMKAYGWKIEAPGGGMQYFTRDKSSWSKK